MSAGMLLTLVIGVGFGMMLQRFLRSRRDLRGARAFVKTASKAHWRGSVPRLLIWGFVAACAVVGAVRAMAG
jgi:hypothetical protein